MTAQIKIKPHLKAHRLSVDEVLLLGEGEQYVLRGAVYAALMPLIEGGHDADAMAERLAGQFPPELVHYALLQLEAKGYAQASGAGEGALPPTSASEAVWWSARGLDPSEVAARIAGAKLAGINAGVPAEAFNAMCAELEWRYRVGDEANGIYHNADLQMPLASVVKIIHLVAYAEAVAAGQLDPTSYVTLETLDSYYLPGYDLGSHNQAITELTEAGLVLANPDRIRLEDVPWMMMRHSANAATDYLH
ncbi:MAG: serine hydrolase, partial [Alphaproteobacteria bacterium]